MDDDVDMDGDVDIDWDVDEDIDADVNDDGGVDANNDADDYDDNDVDVDVDVDVDEDLDADVNDDVDVDTDADGDMDVNGDGDVNYDVNADADDDGDVDTDVDADVENLNAWCASGFVERCSNDEHRRSQPHQSSAIHPIFPSGHLSRLDDLGSVNNLRFASGSEQIVIRLDRDVYKPIARLLNFVDIRNFVGHVSSSVYFIRVRLSVLHKRRTDIY